jgi:uncharacterized protein (DUF1697 family)
MTSTAATETYIALLRGVNVGGKNKLPMQQLAAIFAAAEAEQVKSYIQSGNVVFRYRPAAIHSLPDYVAAQIKQQFGFAPSVLILSLADLLAAMQNNPFPEAESTPAALHLGFLSAIPQQPDLEKMAKLKTDSEQFQLIGRVFYLRAPEGIGRSKLAAGSEKLLGVSMTVRNWNTVGKLKELATE